MIKPPEITCPECNGKGTSPISGVLLETYQIVKRLKKAKTKEILSEVQDDVTVSAICNRLEDLFKTGLVRRKRIGNSFQYSICRK